VFPNVQGNPTEAANFHHRHWKPLLKRAVLPDIRFHDLRHTCATLLLTQGVQPKIVSEMLGHANICITLDTYNHVVPSLGKAAANVMEDTLCAHRCDSRHTRSRRAGGTFERGDIVLYASQDSVSERATLGGWSSCSFR
jgi:hypothetical protein